MPQVACFDTAFHHDQPPVAQAFALPPEITGRGVRRYGFHGTSHAYVARQTAELLDLPADRAKVITLHLGNGASACAVSGGRSLPSQVRGAGA